MIAKRNMLQMTTDNVSMSVQFQEVPVHPDLSLSVTRSSERLEICRECPRFFKPTASCKECGCFMRVKTLLADATCPLEKW